MNDFDEVALAPVTLDILRLLTSIRVALADPTAGIVTGPDASNHRQLLALVLESYAKTLAKGKALSQDADTARGLIADLLSGRKTRSRSDFIAARTVAGETGLLLRTDHGKALPVSGAEREQVGRWLEGYASGQPDPGFYQVRDVARRIAGTGSLGLPRYVILVAGKATDPHNPEGHYLLDLKAAAPSCLAGLPGIGEQPDWGPPERAEAERIVSLQTRMQGAPMARLQAVCFAGAPFVLKALLPTQDRVSWEKAVLHPHKLKDLLTDFARIAAWDHLRAADHRGAASVKDLKALGQQLDGGSSLLPLADALAAQVFADWQTFRTWWATQTPGASEHG